MNVSKANSKKKAYIKRNIPLTIMALPALILMIMFTYVPMFGLVMAFNNYTPRMGIFGSEWVGLDNFKYIFSSGEIYRAIGNTVLYNILFSISIPLCALFMAVMLYFIESKRAAKFYQKSIVVPFMVSYVIIGYIVFIFLSNEYGLVNNMIEALGGKRISWYMEPKYWRVILVIVNTWYGAGVKSVFYYAAMLAIDKSYFEAAELDGATRWHKVKYIMLPEIAPTICIFMVTDLGHILNSNLALFQSVPKDSSALYSATDVLATYVYRGLTGGTYSITTALGLFTGVVSTIMTLSVNKVVKIISPGNEML